MRVIDDENRRYQKIICYLYDTVTRSFFSYILIENFKILN